MSITNPLELFKRIRRLHKYLPPEMRLIGNKYLSEEFKRHKDAELYHVGIFMREWNSYHNELLKQLLIQEDQHLQKLFAYDISSDKKESNGQKEGKNVFNLGKKLDHDTLNQLTDAQLAQLYELRKAAKGEEGKERNRSQGSL